jgi:hypothetical protein
MSYKNKLLKMQTVTITDYNAILITKASYRHQMIITLGIEFLKTLKN